MKKLFEFLLVMILLAMTVVPVISASAESAILGDADGDGEVTVIDVTVIQRYDAGITVPESFCESCADVDGDGEVTIVDATWIQRYLVDLPSPLDKLSNDELYERAVRDCVYANDVEILPLVNITRDDENVIWDGDRVLMTFMHRYPDSYPAGDTINLQWGDVWCVAAGEMYQWVKDNDGNVEDWTERFHQVLGMPTSKNNTTITGIWVDADLLYRPAYVTDPTADMQTTFVPTGDDAFDTMYQEWFDKNIVSSYVTGSYPWTRLGYTYDWADNGTEYGLSEFLVFCGEDATVAYTYSVEDFVAFAMAQ